MATLAAKSQLFLAQPRIAVAGGDACYPSLATISGGVNTVVIVTNPHLSEEIVRQCPGGCPLMFGKTSDFGHRCMRWIMRASGRLAA